MKLNVSFLMLCFLVSLNSAIYDLPVLGNNESTSNHSVPQVGDFDRDLGAATSESDTVLLRSSYFISKKEYQKGIELLEKSTKEFPQNKEYRSALCKAHIKFGDDFSKHNDEKNAVFEYQNALSVDKANAEATEKLKRVK